MFHEINPNAWERKEYFDHYFTKVICTYSMTTELDVTRLRAQVRECGAKLFPVMLYCISNIVNRHDEFRMGFRDGKLGVHDCVNPSYTFFHKDTETFSNLWTEYDPELGRFYSNYLADVAEYGEVHQMTAKPEGGDNIFNVSSIPWTSFTGFNLNVKSFDYLPPIFTLGKFFDRQGRVLMPLAVQVHHAVCDGFHTARLINELQALMDEICLDDILPAST